MKYALFEFVTEKTCEVGETTWIIREDPDTFNDACWDSKKEIMVAWPCEYSKLSKKIIKSSIDPGSVETTTCVAKVVKFSDNYDAIRQHAKRFSETGSTTTPLHGRGKRVAKKNLKYLNSDSEDEDEDEDEDDIVPEKANKRQKKHLSVLSAVKNDELEKLKAKYDFTKSKSTGLEEETDYETESSGNNVTLKRENALLRQKLKRKEEEIKHLQGVIKDLEYMPSLQDIVVDLRKQVEQLSYRPKSLRCESPTLSGQTSTHSSSRSSSLSTSPYVSASESDVEGDLVTLSPNIKITKAQAQILKAKTNQKDFVYAIMSMLWSREVLYGHSITGKSSNAYKGKEAKPQLDPGKVNSICELASKKYGTTVANIRLIMISKINNIAKVIRAKERLSVDKKDLSI